MMKIKQPAIFLCRIAGLMLLACLMGASVWAQDTRVSATAARSSLQTAEPVWVTVTIESNAPRSVELVADTVGPFLILDRVTGKPISRNGLVTSEEKLLLAAFDSGTLTMPPLLVPTPTGSVASNSLQIEVTPPPVDSLQQFRPVKEWAPLEATDQRWWWLLVIAAAVALLVFAWWRSTRRRKSGEASVTRPAGFSGSITGWEQLEKAWVNGSINSEQLANQWMELYRRQVALVPQSRHTVTAAEVLVHWRQSGAAAMPAGLSESLEQCQAAQFARLQLDAPAGLKLIELGQQLTTRKEAATHAQ